MSPVPTISLSTVTKRYGTAHGDFTALLDVNLACHQGEFVAITGRSGSGKSTLLNMITGIDRPSAGLVAIQGRTINQLNERELAIWRGRNVGVVFQFFQLIPTLSIAENVMLPMDFCDVHASRQRRRMALELLDRLDIDDQANKFPANLSGGQQQRAAIARALANNPPLICADEPTGNLDSATGQRILELFGSLAREGRTVILVSHQEDIASIVQRTIRIVDGRISGESSHHE